jgi:hypothetical protein
MVSLTTNGNSACLNEYLQMRAATGSLGAEWDIANLSENTAAVTVSDSSDNDAATSEWAGPNAFFTGTNFVQTCVDLP